MVLLNYLVHNPALAPIEEIIPKMKLRVLVTSWLVTILTVPSF